MAETSDTKWKDLRKAFPKEVIGKLPKGGIQLDFVGHAAVTDRLLSVDPEWHWEPLGVDEHGLPALDKEGNLWIMLTVCGVTRIGVGDGKNMKERIGDALRNAAMRFGVALDLWTKDELESTLEDPGLKNDKATAPAKQPATPQEHVKQVFSEDEPKRAPGLISDKQLRFMQANFNDLGVTDRDDKLAYVTDILDRDVASATELTLAEAKRVIDRQLEEKKERGIE